MEPGLAIHEFLEYVVSGLIGESGDFSISREAREGKTCYRIQVAPEDAGRVVGKHGRTIIAIRSLVKASSEKHHFEADVEVMRDSI